MLTADYTTALTLLLRYPSPQPHAAQTFVHDALYLEQNPTADRGKFIISKYSGRPPDSRSRSQSGTRPARRAFLWEDFKKRSGSSSPAGSPARNSSPKSLENIFQDVSQGIQRRTEAWGVAKAVRGAVTEARKNMQTMHYDPKLRPVSVASASDIPSRVPTQPRALGGIRSPDLGAMAGLEMSIAKRNQALSSTLREALDELGSLSASFKHLDPDTNSAVKQALAKADSVQVRLQDPSLPVDYPQDPGLDEKLQEHHSQETMTALDPMGTAEGDVIADKSQLQTPKPTNTDKPGPAAESGTPSNPVCLDTAIRTNTDKKIKSTPAKVPSRSTVRPSMTDSGFSWMLGGGRNLSGFVSSTSPPPEQTRHLDQPRGKPNALFGSGGDENSGTDAEQGDLALYSLRGSREPQSGAGPS